MKLAVAQCYMYSGEEILDCTYIPCELKGRESYRLPMVYEFVAGTFVIEQYLRLSMRVRHLISVTLNMGQKKRKHGDKSKPVQRIMVAVTATEIGTAKRGYMYMFNQPDIH